MTLRMRLTTWYALVGAATLLVVGLAVWLQYAGALRQALDEVLQARAGAVVDLLEANRNGIPDAGPLERGLFLIVFDSAGRTAYASRGAPMIGRPAPGFSTLLAGGQAGVAIDAVSAPVGRTVVAGSSLVEVDRSLDSLARTMALVGVAGALLSAFGGWWLAGSALTPVARLAAEADAIGLSELDRRLPEPARNDELGALARTLNRMLDRVEEAVRRQRAFVAGASHDLRTPLAALRTELELALLRPGDAPALRAAVEGAHTDAVRLGELANALLRLAAAEPDGRPIERDDVELGHLVADGIDLAQAAADSRNVAVRVRAPKVSLRVDRARLVQAIVNLVANAVRFAPDGTTVEVEAELDTARQPRVLRLDVLDRGPGVAPAVRGSLFEPFSRDRGADVVGTGLGLATAAAAIRAHGGAIGYDDREGGGAHFWFWVPV